ncbi:hypothetical protein JOC77_003192 [Peribacillus deserti]|uniref:Uncharacterized protein n=1 Tax=Peribacillus deserti TaxID=673318 RepID=A0ABS2QKR6_9BACI|nr:hypothetical protein [Peribacillus deserti]
MSILLLIGLLGVILVVLFKGQFIDNIKQFII